MSSSSFRQRLIGVLISAVVTTASISLSAAPALATVSTTSHAQDDNITAAEISNALTDARKMSGKPIATAAPSTSDSDEAAIVKTKGGTDVVRVPTTSKDGVSLSPGTDDSIIVNLPNATSASLATKLSDGSIAYPSDAGAANVVIPTETGAQFLTVIAHRSAPQRYTYPLGLPDGAQVTLTEDGGARVAKSDGTTLARVAPAWARDSNGMSVPTHFETDGISLTQVVEHSSAPGILYPVVADPNFWQTILDMALV